LAVENDIKTIAFPNISTGIYGYPKKDACNVAFDTVSNFLQENMFIISVVFCCFDEENYKLYNEKLQQMKKEN
jgi:O-acetyl-ADP-ribose deacetylase (regulator of RNase III)